MNRNILMRIIDENFNRLAEGLRVMEDIARMGLNDAGLTFQLKNLRHALIRADLPFNLALLNARDAAQDVGEKLEVNGEQRNRDLPLVALANARRAQEALRVLEELAPLVEIPLNSDAAGFKSARFALYTLEKELVDRLVRRTQRARLKGLYVIIDLQFLGEKDPLETAGILIQAGVKIIQLRDKYPDKKRLLDLAIRMQEMCRHNQTIFIVNDHLDIALASGADGLHIGQRDLPAASARALLPLGSILGVSTASPGEAREAEAAGADYLGVGNIFPTSTKQKSGSVGIERIQQIRTVTNLPLVAIGGINENNIAGVMAAGADSACVVSAVLGAPDIARAALNLIHKIEAIK